MPLIPESAPFTADQRAWLNGFLAGWLNEGAVGSAVPLTAGATEPLLILYGSQSGNAEGFAKKIGKEAGSKGYLARVLSLDEGVKIDLLKERHLFIVTSTWGDGEMPDNAKGFWEYLLSDRVPSLTHLQYAVLAFGDRNYPDFCQAGKSIDLQLEKLGAKRLLPCVECDVDFESVAQKWVEQSWVTLGGGDSSLFAADSTLLEKKERGSSSYDRKNPFRAKMIGQQRLNQMGSSKDVRHIEIDLTGSNLSYEVGDALGVFAQNDITLVQSILKIQGWNGEEAVMVPDQGVRSIAEALINSLEITKLNQRLLEVFSGKSGNGELRSLLAPEKKKALDQFCWGRDLFDLLSSSPQTLFKPQELVDLLRKQNVRLYSIASSIKAHPNQVHLTVGAVRYESLGRKRGGVCSTFLADRVKEGGEVAVFVHVSPGFRPPLDPETAMIMVGPGTGIAPFRAFLEERKATKAGGRNWLFFGDQHAKSDFLYQSEIENYFREGVITHLDTAFSRDQEEKIYVQTRMKEKAAALWEWIEGGAHFYVCGDASRMAKDVDLALHEIIMEQGKKSEAAAAEYVQQLKQTKRYQRDVY